MGIWARCHKCIPSIFPRVSLFLRYEAMKKTEKRTLSDLADKTMNVTEKKAKPEGADCTETQSNTSKCPGIMKFVYKEQKGDLFSCGSDVSLAHCVSADMALGKGIAVEFKKRFGGISELKKQGKKPGEVAVLKRDGRYIYYLVTKLRFFHKPTYGTLQSSLEEMKKHCIDNDICSIAMPKIGCGLDRLVWKEVSQMLQDIFKDQNMTITVYYL